MHASASAAAGRRAPGVGRLRRRAPGAPAVLVRPVAGVPPRAAAPAVPPVDAGQHRERGDTDQGEQESRVRCSTLLSHAAAAASAIVEPSPSNGQQREGAESDASDNIGVTWAAWGPRATSISDHTSFEWNDLLGERRATVDQSGHRIRIYDYNPYRIREARTSGLRKGHNGQVGGEGGRPTGNSDEGEGWEGGNRAHPNGTRRITETSTIRGGEWFRDDVCTALPHLDTVIYKPGCRAIYMEQDQLLLHVDELDDVSASLSHAAY